ncbi:hypothetical protein [Pontiella sulfatireligans]|nr:hypothetical protein [Pontiella sulfatireligans]
MEDAITIPFCAPAPSDVLPMLVVAAVFLLAGWGIRRRKRKRASKHPKE